MPHPLSLLNPHSLHTSHFSPYEYPLLLYHRDNFAHLLFSPADYQPISLRLRDGIVMLYVSHLYTHLPFLVCFTFPRYILLVIEPLASCLVPPLSFAYG